jgi:nicotinamidase/pyrazinamidase
MAGVEGSMEHKEKQNSTWLVALLSLLAAITLALVHILWTPADGNRLGQLLIQTIPSAIVVLLTLPVLYFVLLRHGIELLSGCAFDADEVVDAVVKSIGGECPVHTSDLVNTAHASTPMQRIEAEVTKIEQGMAPLATEVPSTPPTKRSQRDVLVVVDIQKDFFDTGALPVVNATSLLQPLNEAIAEAHRAGALIVFTQDWHPKDHRSFTKFGGAWPEHCIQGSEGAKLHPDLVQPASFETIKFGTDPDKDGYSPFENPEMTRLVTGDDIREIFVVGIAAEYCVLATCLVARNADKAVTVVEDLVRAADPTQLDVTWKRYDDGRVRRIQESPWKDR